MTESRPVNMNQLMMKHREYLEIIINHQLIMRQTSLSMINPDYQQVSRYEPLANHWWASIKRCWLFYLMIHGGSAVPNHYQPSRTIFIYLGCLKPCLLTMTYHDYHALLDQVISDGTFCSQLLSSVIMIKNHYLPWSTSIIWQLTHIHYPLLSNQ